MAKGKSNTNAEILQYALTHLEAERDQIQAKIDHIHSQLGGKKAASAVAAVSSASEAAPRTKRRLNAAARKRIAAAQKKRWAEYHKAKAKAAKSE